MSKPIWRRIKADVDGECVVNMHHVVAIHFGEFPEPLSLRREAAMGFEARVIRICLANGQMIQLKDSENNRRYIEETLEETG